MAPEHMAALQAVRAYLRRGSGAIEDPAARQRVQLAAAGIDCTIDCDEGAGASA